MNKYFWLFAFIGIANISSAQTNAPGKSDIGELHGNFQVDAQYYNVDTLIGAPIVPEKILSNGFMNLWYTRGNFSGGLRYENYLNVMQEIGRAHV